MSEALAPPRFSKGDLLHGLKSSLCGIVCQDYFNELATILIFRADSTTYSDGSAPILPAVSLFGMDLSDVRRQIVTVRERRFEQSGQPSEWTITAVAKRADIGQSALSKIEDLTKSGDRIQAQSILAIITKGLGYKLSDFFAEIERRKTKSDVTSPAVSVTSASNPPVPHGGARGSLSALRSSDAIGVVADALDAAAVMLRNAGLHRSGTDAGRPDQPVEDTARHRKKRGPSGGR